MVLHRPIHNTHQLASTDTLRIDPRQLDLTSHLTHLVLRFLTSSADWKSHQYCHLTKRSRSHYRVAPINNIRKRHCAPTLSLWLQLSKDTPTPRRTAVFQPSRLVAMLPATLRTFC